MEENKEKTAQWGGTETRDDNLSVRQILDKAFQEAREIRKEAESYRENVLADAFKRSEEVYQELVAAAQQAAEKLKTEAIRQSEEMLETAKNETSRIKASAAEVMASAERRFQEAEKLLANTRAEVERMLSEALAEGEEIKARSLKEVDDRKAEIDSLEAAYHDFIEKAVAFLETTKGRPALSAEPAIQTTAVTEAPAESYAEEEAAAFLSEEMAEGAEEVAAYQTAAEEMPRAEAFEPFPTEEAPEVAPQEEIVPTVAGMQEEMEEQLEAPVQETSLTLPAAEPVEEQVPAEEIPPQIQRPKETPFLEAFKSFLKGSSRVEAQGKPSTTVEAEKYPPAQEPPILSGEPVSRAEEESSRLEPEPSPAATATRYEGEVDIVVEPLYSLDNLTRFQGYLLRVPNVKQVKSIRTSESSKGAIMTVLLGSPTELGESLRQLLPTGSVEESKDRIRIQLPPSW